MTSALPFDGRARDSLPCPRPPEVPELHDVTREWADPKQFVRPASVPGYEIIEKRGRGGMGVIYTARHFGLNRLCALKMILADGLAGEIQQSRFRTEAPAPFPKLTLSPIVGTRS